MLTLEFGEDIEKPGSVAHPWPYLSSIFALKSVNGMKVKLCCLLCIPKPKECCASLSSLLNLCTHVKVSSLYVIYI